MDAIRAFFQSFREAWKRSSRSQQLLVLCGLAVAAMVVVGVGIWSSRPEYVPFANDLGPAQAAEIVSKLEAAGIPHRLNFSGSEVLVDKSRWQDAALAAGDLANPVQPPVDAFASGPFDDPTLGHFRILRQQEALLARTIGQIKSVNAATVHISRPEPSPFRNERLATQASVVLELRRGVPFGREQAAAIVAMVSHSVEGLDPKNVTLVDTEGRILSSDAGDLPSSVSSQLDFRRSLESDLASKAEAMLTQVLGPGRAVVRLTADIDFTQTTRTENSIDPEATAKTSELIKTSTTTESPQAAGAVGTSSNIGATATAALSPTKPVVSKTEEIDAQYENSRITNTITEAAGQIRRLTIAAAVDLPEANATGSAASSTTAPGAITRQQVEGIIKQAVGFDTSRGDAIDVVVSRLSGLEDLIVEPPAGLSAWRQYEGLVRSASLGIAALVAFSLGLLTLRRLRPIGVPVGHAQDLSPDLAQRLAELSQRAQDDPQSVATALAAWLNTADDAAARQRKSAA